MNLEDIKNLGKVHLKLLNNMNIFTTTDLVEYYPYKYNFITFKNLNNLSNNENNYINVLVISEPIVTYFRRNLNRLTFLALIDNQSITITIFNRAFLKSKIKINTYITLNGKYDKVKNNFTTKDILFNSVNNTIEPIYHLKEGLTQNNLENYIKEAYEKNDTFIDKIPAYLNNKYTFINKETALKYIHFPNNIQEIKKAKLKLIYEELFIFMVKINFLKNTNSLIKGIKRNIDSNVNKDFLEAISFTPTTDQCKAFDEIKLDMSSNYKMNRLILGDVGSGKTLTALYSCFLNKLSGYQTAFMAPTELLAIQHFNSSKELLQKLGIISEVITGKTTKKDKDIIKKKLLNGEIDLIIGTHSLISDNIIFNNLGLVITDEEHRFGVIQRKNLENKGINPDVLYLSATPIPRTYAKVIYNDMTVSIIKTKPIGRKEIITKIIKNIDIRNMLKQMHSEIKKGHQIFVVSPLIENKEIDLVSVTDLKVNYSKAFGDNAKIEIIHGKMKNNEKDKIMNDFSKGNIDILISTTVIEVGIDIPNATVMCIYNAERFGLATLHQLRGRVGRSNNNSYCFLVSEHDNKRLKVMEESNDGFYITEKDYEDRKEGDLFGTKQSGEQIFKIANLKNDYQILLQASKDAEDFVSNKKYLDNNYYKDIYNNIKKLT